MEAERGGDVSQVLRELSNGQRGALDQLIPLAYDELKRIAHRHLRHERLDHTLSTTALVNEAYLKLAGANGLEWRHRAHFFAVAARVMRQILTDYARRRGRQKRGGAWIRVPLTDDFEPFRDQGLPLFELEQALVRLEARSERLCRVVECRCFAGMSIEETAEALGTSPATVKRDWAFSRAWLNRELSAERESARG